MNPLIGLIIKGVTSFAERRGRISEAKENATIEAIKVRGQNAGWMDDYLLLLHSLPMIMVFIPTTRVTALAGITALNSLPEWYLLVWFSMVGAVWGLPKLSGLTSSMRRNKK